MALYSKKKALKPLYSPSVHKIRWFECFAFSSSHFIVLFHIYVFLFSTSVTTTYERHIFGLFKMQNVFSLLASSSDFFASFDGMLTFRPLAILCPFLRLVWHSFKISSVESSEESKTKEKKNEFIKTNTCAQHARYNVWPLKTTIIKEKRIKQWNVYFIAADNEIKQNHFKKR